MGFPTEWEQVALDKGLVPARVDAGHRAAGGSYADQRKPTYSRGVELTEAEFTERVIDFAQGNGWRSAHFRAARTEHGWRTAVSGDGKGFVDLVLVRERVVWCELKTDKGRLSPEQAAWRRVLLDAKQEVYLWRPRQWGEIEQVLGIPRPSP